MANHKKALPSGNQYGNIDASPVKSFFVEMLTRDIELKYAVLDLLDNCVDGIQRSVPKLKKNKPYQGYYANINFDRNKFSIDDNCGGIPWRLHNYAFRMGRANPNVEKGIKTVGVYGIGMKRAIFKIGRECVIRTQDVSHSYEVKISEQWTKNDDWMLPVKTTNRRKNDGTKIEITIIPEGIKEQFGGEVFPDDLKKAISTSYAFIIQKGFNIKVNGDEINPKSTNLKFTKSTKKKDVIAPFIYKASHKGVDVFLAVGFTSPLIGEDMVDQENYKSRYSAIDAGWTIICNDRVVEYCGKTELTGWGSAGVPLFHNQFNSISGIVEFSSDDARKLPTTTTKRGIEASSPLYLHIRDKMIEGMKIFTDYTNQWKGKKLLEQSKKEIDSVPTLSLDKIKMKSESIEMTKTRPRGSVGVSGTQFKPQLPKPPGQGTSVQTIDIHFKRKRKEVEHVADYIYGKKDIPPNEVGEQCFEIILDKARG